MLYGYSCYRVQPCLLLSFAPTGLANEAMDAMRSWMTTSDDDHAEQLELSAT